MKPYLLYPVLEQLIVSPFCTTFQLAKQAGLSEKNRTDVSEAGRCFTSRILIDAYTKTRLRNNTFRKQGKYDEAANLSA